jgi:hypothetical protein
VDNLDRQRRRILRHGFIFLFVAPCLGLAIVLLPHPRAWMAAHLSAFFTSLILVAIGLLWRELRLSDRQRAVAFRAGLLSAYLGLAANVFGAIVDLPGPASNPGVAPAASQAVVFFSLLAVIVPATFIAFGLVLWGMRGD